jgi:hypothetical protein
MRAILLGAAFLFVSATAAGAGECPALQAQIDTQFGKRFDRQAGEVKAKAAEAMALHRAGKHDESVKAYDEAAKAGSIQLTHKAK